MAAAAEECRDAALVGLLTSELELFVFQSYTLMLDDKMVKLSR